jgi:hypothetical protein
MKRIDMKGRLRHWSMVGEERSSRGAWPAYLIGNLLHGLCGIARTFMRDASDPSDGSPLPPTLMLAPGRLEEMLAHRWLAPQGYCVWAQLEQPPNSGAGVHVRGPFYRRTFGTQGFVLGAYVRLFGPERFHSAKRFDSANSTGSDLVGLGLPELTDADRADLLAQACAMR